MRVLISLTFSICFVFAALAQSKQQVKQIEQSLQQKMDSLSEAYSGTGINLSIILPNNKSLDLSSGFAFRESEEKLTPKHQMLGGSTGKVFYSVVIMQLIADGILALDEPISTYIGDESWFNRIPNAKDLTIRALLRHETGIPRYVFKEGFQAEVVKDADRIWKPEELVAFVFDDEPQFAVGESFAYSDTNYIIACMVVEKVTGNSLYEEVDKRVLKKAKLKDVEFQDKRSYKNLAQGYNGIEDPFFPGKALDEDGKSRFNWQFEWAGGGLVITAHDLAKLGKLIYEGEMFESRLLDEYFNGREAVGMRGNWGLGVHIQETPFGLTYGHSGFMPGYITNMMYFKDQQFALCYQINSTQPEDRMILRELPRLVGIIQAALK